MGSNEKATKDQLNNSNFKIWKQELFLLLMGKGLADHISNDKIRKVSGSNLSDEDKTKLQSVPGTDDMFYSKEVTKDLLCKDARAKEFILNSISNDLAENFDFISATTFEIYNLIKGQNECEVEESIAKLKESLKKTKYDSNNDISLAIFISNMNMKFEELKKLKAEVKYIEKFDYLYNAIPEELAIKSNMLTFEGSWEELTEKIIKVNQHLRRLNKGSGEQDQSQANAVSVKNNRTTGYTKEDKHEIECWVCHKRGHKARDCFKNKKNRNKQRKAGRRYYK